MDTPRCEGCGLPAKLVCFCVRSFLCERCVGKHLIDAPDLSHKPCPLKSEGAKIYGAQEALRTKEGEVMAKSRAPITAAIRKKLGQEVSKVRALRPIVVESVSMAVKAVTNQLPELAEKLSREMLAVCEAHESLLESALAHFEGRVQNSSNAVVRLLETFHSLAEVEAAEVLTCTLQVGQINAEPMMRAGLAFSVAVKSLNREKFAGKSIIPKCYRKSDAASRRLSVSRRKATQSLNSSVDQEPFSEHLCAERMKQTPDFFKCGSPGDSSIVDTCNEEDLRKAEHPSPDPPHLRGESGLRKVGDKRFTRLQAARTRKALMRGCEKHTSQPLAPSGDFSDSPESLEDIVFTERAQGLHVVYEQRYLNGSFPRESRLPSKGLEMYPCRADASYMCEKMPVCFLKIVGSCAIASLYTGFCLSPNGFCLSANSVTPFMRRASPRSCGAYWSGSKVMGL